MPAPSPPADLSPVEASKARFPQRSVAMAPVLPVAAVVAPAAASTSPSACGNPATGDQSLSGYSQDPPAAVLEQAGATSSPDP